MSRVSPRSPKAERNYHVDRKIPVNPWVASSVLPGMVLLDNAMLLLLNGAALPMQPALRTQAAVNMHGPAMNMNMPALNTPGAALLMSPFPVLATMMKEQLQASALRYVQGANDLMDMAMSDDGMSDTASMLSDSIDEAALPPQEESIGATAMVGAAAAAMALMQLRGGMQHG
mmetsp:Transcript_13346/g.34224  ORF Transcript_13346/g.34224 Transcript_13346/m.34224 type:complete len:173 (+) Transcript_13346:2-520(+)